MNAKNDRDSIKLLKKMKRILFLIKMSHRFINLSFYKTNRLKVQLPGNCFQAFNRMNMVPDGNYPPTLTECAFCALGQCIRVIVCDDDMATRLQNPFPLFQSLLDIFNMRDGKC